MYEGVRYLGNPDEPYMVMVAAEDAARTELIVHEDTRFIVAQYEEGHSFEEDLYKSLESVYIGKSVEFIEKGVFWGSTSLVSIQVSQENPYFHDQNNCLIHTETKTLVTGCRTSIIPDDGSVTAIGNQAFYKVEGIRIMVIPDTVTEIGGNAFCACPDLESIVIGSGVQYIDHDVFIYSDKFTTVYYHGTQSQWEQIQIVGINCGNGLGDNIEIKKATIYFYSETEPTQPGNYWRYVDGVPTPWKTEET